MVMNVTRPDLGLALTARGKPRVHVSVFKGVGDTLMCSWACKNEGGAPGSAFMRLINTSSGWTLSPIVATSTLVSIPGGLMVNLLLTVFNLELGVHVKNGFNTMRLDMYREVGTLIQIHDFPLNIQ